MPDPLERINPGYETAKGEVYYSDVHQSWVLRYEVGGEPYSHNITESEALALVNG